MLELVKALLCRLEVFAVELAHAGNFFLELFLKAAQIVLEARPERHQRVLHTLFFGTREVTVRLDLALNVLKLGFQLLFAFYALQ